MKITCYGGVGEIGGNKVMVEDGEARFFFDFGIPFGERARFFEEFLNPRAATGLLDVIEMGLLPPLEGAYRRDLEPPGAFWQRIKNSPHLKSPSQRIDKVDGVLVSHAHVDHIGYISFLRPDMPVYTSAMTGFIAKAMQDSGVTDFEREIVYAVPREEREGVLQTMRNSKANSAPASQRPFRFHDLQRLGPDALSFWSETPGSRDLSPVPPAVADSIGGLALRAFPVDHSIFGSTAYAVETSAGWVVYTGDVRIQGAAAEQTRRFVEEVAKLRPRVLICEGTRLTPEHESGHSATEEEVRLNALRAIQQTSGLVVADFGPRNIERLRSFLDIAREAKRYLVILDKDAYLLNAMRMVDPTVPSLADTENILVYQDIRVTLTLWQRELRATFAHRIVGPSQVKANLAQFILCFSFWDVKNIIDIDPPSGLYLYSSSEVHDEEQGVDMWRLRNWLQHFNLMSLGLPIQTIDEMGRSIYAISDSERGLHASGHATGGEILDMVRRIAPQTVIPVHTQHPGLFAEKLYESGIEVRLPEYGVPLEFA